MRAVLLLAILLGAQGCNAQESEPEPAALSWVSLRVSDAVGNQEEPDVREAILLWERYLNERVIRNGPPEHWSEAERQQYRVPDRMLLGKIRAYGPRLEKVKPTLVSARRQDEQLVLKTFFGMVDSSGYSLPCLMVDVLARREGDSMRLFRPLEWNTRHWRQEKVGKITYHFPWTHTFNDSLALAFAGLNEELGVFFGTAPIAFDYYLYGSAMELFRANGFDYDTRMFTDEQVGGMADPYNNLLHAANGTEWYSHELVHLYAAAVYPERHYWLEEGLATFMGGSVGRPLEWHLQRVAAYYNVHPDLDWNHPWRLGKVDDTTDIRYAIAGLFIKLAYEKEGLPGITHLMLQSGRDDERAYQVLAAYFGISQNELGVFIARQLEAYHQDSIINEN